jgi:hypothetical protein
MIPPVTAVLNIEMIRDGGSLALQFESESFSRYILFTKIIVAPGPKRCGYSEPVLIDCDPAKRPPDTDNRIYSELSGPADPVSWKEARAIIAAASRLVNGLSKWESRWLEMLKHVANTDGALPPGLGD